MPIRQIIRNWWIHIVIIIFILSWYLLTNYGPFKADDKLLSVFIYAILFAGFIWLILARIIRQNETQIRTRLQVRMPGSRPFEYLFFIFLFLASFFVTVLSIIQDYSDIKQYIIYVFLISFFYVGALVIGWFNYIRLLHTPECLETSNENVFMFGKGNIYFLIFVIIIIFLLTISVLYNNAIWIWSALSSIGTLSLAFLVVYKDFLQRPEIDIVFEQIEPYCRTAQANVYSPGQTNPVLRDGYWIRVKVINKGKKVAKNCEGRLVEIEYGDGSLFQPFDPVVLHWVGRQDFNRININSLDYEYLDVIYTLDGSDEAIINCAESQQNGPLPSRGIDTRLPPSPYIIKISVSSENAKPNSKKYLLDCNGTWNEIRMSEM